MTQTTLPLCAITRISPLNPRYGAEDDVGQLAATIAAAGLQYPLIVWPRPDVEGEFEVLDGGRRWRALQARAKPTDEVAVEILEGDEAVARRAALAVSVTPRALHPVDEFEAFAKLDAAGFSVFEIARDFGLSERHVRQRLALAALAPCIRNAWRKGGISREAAEAWTTGPVEVQEATFAAWSESWPRMIDRPHDIRREMRGDGGLDANEPVAIYISQHPAALETYLAAGGRIHEDLFSETTALLDPAIAELAVNEFLAIEAMRIAEKEGWGDSFAAVDGDWLDHEPTLSEGEQARLDALEDAIWSAQEGEKAALVEERDLMLLSATLREFGPEERQARAVGVYLDADGEVCISRGIKLGKVADRLDEDDAGESGEELDDGEVADPDDQDADDGDQEARDETRGPFAEPPKALRAVIERTVTNGLGSAIAGRVDLALMFAVAALGCRYGVTGLSAINAVSTRDDDELPELARQISDLPFPEALAICAAAPNCDLSVAFAALIGQSLNVTNAVSMKSIGVLCGAARARGSNLVAAFDAALDRRSFFEAAPKDQTLRIVAGLIGEGEASRCRKMDKPSLAQYVANLSADKGHLPSPLADWAALPALADADEPMIVDPAPSLAGAMAAAIDADEKSPRKRRPRAKSKQEA